MPFLCMRYRVYVQMRCSRKEVVSVCYPVPFLSCSFTGALYSPCGGPENHERQCRGLQVHYPLLGGGVHHRRLMGERHCFTHLR